MLKYNFQMQVDSKVTGSFLSSLDAITSEDAKHIFGLLEAGEKGNSSDLGQFLSRVKIHKDKSQTFKFKWRPSDRGKGKFQNIKSQKGTFRLRLILRLVDEKSNAKWVDSAEFKDATVKDIAVDARDGLEVVEINYAPKSMDWEETLKDQDE
jgi:hypothetical protein